MANDTHKVSNNIHPIFDRMLPRNEREAFLNQKSLVIWLVGLSGSGKSTIAIELERLLFTKGYFVQMLDGDNIRSGINNNLGFSKDDRLENNRRIAEVSKLYVNSGLITINSFISPTQEIRNAVKDIIGKDYFEVFIDTPLEVCEQRDVKGLFAKARKGEIKGFTGIDSPFEAPTESNLRITTIDQSIQTCAQLIYSKIEERIKR